jgi:hypothetical protein
MEKEGFGIFTAGPWKSNLVEGKYNLLAEQLIRNKKV